MNADHLRTYLKDHFAGSVAATQLLDHLISAHSGKPLEQVFGDLRREIGEDQDALQQILKQLGGSEGLVRNATAFVGEKLSRVKLLLEDPAGSGLSLLEKLEALALGIQGKRMLWRSLKTAASDAPALSNIDFDQLDERAESQSRQVEELRVEAARQAFGG
jgi:hypothetical protein